MRNSSQPSEAVDFARDVPTTAEDVAALRRVRELRGPQGRFDWGRLSPSWPPPPALALRPTAEGRRPFELESLPDSTI